MHKGFFIKIIIYLSFFYVSLFGNNFPNITISNKDKIIDNFTISYIKSKEDIDITEVSKLNFEKTISNNFSLGYIPSTLWMKLDIKNNSNNSNFILTVNEHFYEKFNLYYFDKNWIKKENGLFIPLENRDVHTNKLAFKINLEKNQSRTYYLELKGKYSYFGKMLLYTNSNFYIKEQVNTNIFFSFIFGVFSLILMFTIFLYIKLKEKIYIYYFFYSFFYLIYVVNISGMLSYFSLHYYVYILHSAGALTIVFFTFFSIEYLNTKKHLKYFSRVLIFLAFVLIICAVLSMFYYTPWNKIVNNTVGLLTLLWIICSSFLYSKGSSDAKYYTFILVLYAAFIIMFTLMVAGVIEYNLFTRYGYICASTLELVCFTLLLINKYTEAYTKQIVNQNILLELKDNQEKILKLEVKKRTAQLEKSNKKLKFLVHERELLLKEIFHRVKNNFHMILGILWFESQKHKNENLFNDLTNRIKSMAKLHEQLLYTSKSIESIDTKKYIIEILNNINSSYSQRNMKISSEIEDFTLSFEESLSLGIIINEIVSNSIIHNSNLKENHIFISLTSLNEDVQLKIKDKSKKFLLNKKGLGLNLVEEFSRKLKQANYNFIFEEDTTFSLSFKKENSGKN